MLQIELHTAAYTGWRTYSFMKHFCISSVAILTAAIFTTVITGLSANVRAWDKDPNTYDTQVYYNYDTYRKWQFPIIGSLDRDPDYPPPGDPLPWVQGPIGNFIGKFMVPFNFTTMWYEKPLFHLDESPYPMTGYAASAYYHIKFTGPNCVEANMMTNNYATPRRYSEFKALGSGYCGKMCGIGFTMRDFDLNQWDMACYNGSQNQYSYKPVSWGGVRCEKKVENEIFRCDPKVRLQDPNSQSELALRGLGRAFPIQYQCPSTLNNCAQNQWLYITREENIIPATYIEFTEWDDDAPVDCNNPSTHLSHLPEFYESDTTPNRLNEQLANQWCALQNPAKPICQPGSVNYTIGHCRIDSFTEVHSIRASLGFCQKCVAAGAWLAEERFNDALAAVPEEFRATISGELKTIFFASQDYSSPARQPLELFVAKYARAYPQVVALLTKAYLSPVKLPAQGSPDDPIRGDGAFWKRHSNSSASVGASARRRRQPAAREVLAVEAPSVGDRKWSRKYGEVEARLIDGDLYYVPLQNQESYMLPSYLDSKTQGAAK